MSSTSRILPVRNIIRRLLQSKYRFYFKRLAKVAVSLFIYYNLQVTACVNDLGTITH